MKREIDSTIIVLRGSFNPSIYHPAWFQKYDILADYDADQAKIEIVHQDITHFTLDWLTLRATQDQFLVRAESPAHNDELRDFVASTLAVLKHTPITKLGINRDIHVRCDSEQQWHGIGDAVAPKEIWKNSYRNRDWPDSTCLQSEWMNFQARST